MLSAAVNYMLNSKLLRFRITLPRFKRATRGLPHDAGDVPAPAVTQTGEVTPKPPPKPPTPWPAGRLALTNQLWGNGYIFPGGEIETLRLVRPLGTTAAASLLIVGVGSGGAASSVTRNLGTWVTGVDCDPSLVAAAKGLVTRAQLGKKVVIDSWDPANPQFVPKSHHHCLALLPLNGQRPEPILNSLAQALKPGGQLVMTELTAKTPLDPKDPTVKRWAALEKRDPAGIVTGVSLTRMLGRVGLDVRIAEDISSRHIDDTILGWRVLVRDLEEQEQKPTRQQAAFLVAEAELWLMRWRLFKQGQLKMMRWHAINRVPIV